MSILLIACSRNQKNIQNIDPMDQPPLANVTASMVVNQNDMICGMSTASLIADTVTYKGNLYGFCSTRCKNEFITNPTAYVH